jgi:DNA polymerase III subunit beta
MVESNSTIAVLANVLFKVSTEKLTIVASNLNIQLTTTIALVKPSISADTTTIAAQKLLEIVRLLPENQEIHFFQEKDIMVLACGTARYNLLTLPAAQFPLLEHDLQQQSTSDAIEVVMTQGNLKTLLDKTSFSMANKDIRRYLNGLSFRVTPGQIQAISTDGHRLSYCYVNEENTSGAEQQIILPRRSVGELMRLMPSSDDKVTLRILENFITISFGDYVFISKLLEGSFPDCDATINTQRDKKILFPKKALTEVLHRTKILSSSRCGMNLSLSSDKAVFFTRNSDNEESEESMAITYDGAAVDLGFNIRYLLDILNVIESDDVEMHFSDHQSSVMLKCGVNNSTFVVMPLRF